MLLHQLHATTKSLVLPRVANLFRGNVQNLNVCTRVGIRQNASTWTMQPAKQFAKKQSAVSFTTVSVASLGLGLAFSTQPTIHNDSVRGPTTPGTPPARPSAAWDDGLPPPPQSALSLYQLGFGTVAGFCAGVFTKKGLKAAAWLLGGIFVLLQYLASQSLVRVDWGRAASRFESRFHTVDASGASRPPTVGVLWNKTIGFLTADFQPRASFVAGFILGIRLG
ncbi:hypothetical protein FA13DRAFT_1732733 [Coprinellus micaceus]|uniref:FUN14-domain-containing protein n=1 Tax=Coprinellus micaceus TaxID=71717 RepID=A0A4Y7TAS7_COPMI|nr:hypothetical protein FA13DRAFT_1732733 [Coprinellus micaceus]